MIEDVASQLADNAPIPTYEDIISVYNYSKPGSRVREDILDILGFDVTTVPSDETVYNTIYSASPECLKKLAGIIAISKVAMNMDKEEKKLADEMDAVEDNYMDYIKNFRHDRRHVVLELDRLSVSNDFCWDPVKFGKDVNLSMNVVFRGDNTVHITAYPGETLNMILSDYIGVEPTSENLLKAMNTDDWFLHFQTNDKDDNVRFMFHTTLKAYAYEDVSGFYRYLIDCFENYLTRLKEVFGITA